MSSSAPAKEKLKDGMKAKAAEKTDLGLYTLARRVAESDLYDWNPTARYLLSQIATLTIKDEEDNYPEDAPDKFIEDKIGWCWMSQFRLSLRMGVSESTVHKLIKSFRKDEVIFYREWIDDHGTPHAEYKINETVLDAHQRPSQSRGVKRPKRSNRDYTAYENKGAFKKGRDNRRANMDADE